MTVSQMPALSAYQLPRPHSRSAGPANGVSESSRGGLKLTLYTAGKRVQRYFAALCDRIRNPYRGGRTVNPTSVNGSPRISGTASGGISMVPREPDYHAELIPPPDEGIRNNANFLSQKMRFKENELGIRAGHGAIAELLSESTGTSKFFTVREKILAQIKDEFVGILSRELDAQAGKSSVDLGMEKKLTEREIEKIFVRETLEFHARLLAYKKRAYGREIYWRAHFETHPLSTDGFPDMRHRSLLDQARACVYKRLIMTGVRETIGREPRNMAPRKVEELLCKHFRKEALSAMSQFAEAFPRYAEIYSRTKSQVILEFKKEFDRRQGGSGVCGNYVNGRLVSVLRAAQHPRYIVTSADRRVFMARDRAMRPSVLLARASQKVVAEIVGRELSLLRSESE